MSEAAYTPIRVEIIQFRPRGQHQHHSVVGRACVSMPDIGMTFFNVKISTRHGLVVATLPERPILDYDTPVRDAHGKMQFVRTAMFHDNARYIAWSEAVVEAIRAKHPEAFINLPGAPLPAATQERTHHV